MENGPVNILFDSYKSYDTWGLLLENMYISFPVLVEKKVAVPGMDGKLDLSETISPVTYDEREVKFTFSIEGRHEEWHERCSRIANAIHGKKIKVIMDTDPSYYYVGRMMLETAKDNDVLCDIVISGMVDPFKYDLDDGTGDWLWDPFSLVDGIVREYKDIKVSGKREIIIAGRKKRVIPTITCSSPMTLTYGKLTLNLPAGKTKVYELQLGEGEHALEFSGNGTVSVSYRGGSL